MSRNTIGIPTYMSENTIACKPQTTNKKEKKEREKDGSVQVSAGNASDFQELEWQPFRGSLCERKRCFGKG